MEINPPPNVYKMTSYNDTYFSNLTCILYPNESPPKCTITGFINGTGENVTIPYYINDVMNERAYLVTEIADNAFCNQPLIGTVTFAATELTRIGKRAFYGTSVVEVNLSGMNTVVTIDSEAFANNPNLANVAINNGDNIDKSAFYCCPNVAFFMILQGTNVGKSFQYFSNAPFQFSSGSESCLAKGTLVYTPSGYTRIEVLKEGDQIYNQHTQPVYVEQILSNTYTYSTSNPFNVMYKIPKGSLGNSSPVYLTRGHRVIRKNGNAVLPEKLGFLPAPYSEFFEEKGAYTVYHIRVKDSEKNHLVVNGGCVVESWKSPDTKETDS